MHYFHQKLCVCHLFGSLCLLYLPPGCVPYAFITVNHLHNEIWYARIFIEWLLILLICARVLRKREWEPKLIHSLEFRIKNSCFRITVLVIFDIFPLVIQLCHCNCIGDNFWHKVSVSFFLTRIQYSTEFIVNNECNLYTMSYMSAIHFQI